MLMGLMKKVLISLVNAAFCFIAVVCAGAQQTSQRQQPDTLDAKPEPINLTVTVTNSRGELVTGLKQDNFSILVDKTAVKIVSFNDDDAPISVGILFDTSGSMDDHRYGASTRFRVLREALARFLERSNKSNEYFVIGFNRRPQLLLDWTSDATGVIDKLVTLQPKGNTAFYDACYLGVEKVMHGRFSKRAIIVISDGADNHSEHTLDELRRLLKESSPLLYTIDVFHSDDGASSLGMEGQMILDELSKISGGMTFLQQGGVRINFDQVDAVFELIGDELRRQYSIGFSPPTSFGDKRWHRVKVRVTLPPNAPREMHGLSARSREGVFVR